MKALSIKQPFATLILWETKTIETRTWQTDYRGPLLICASQKIHTGTFFFNNDIDCKKWVKANTEGHPTGVMLCVADLIDCRPMTKADEENACCRLYPGAYAWILKNIRPVFQKPVTGKLKLFEVPDRGITLLPVKNIQIISQPVSSN